MMDTLTGNLLTGSSFEPSPGASLVHGCPDVSIGGNSVQLIGLIAIDVQIRKFGLFQAAPE